MKTVTFICYDKYTKTTKKSHIFKKRFSSLADVAKFLKVSNKIYLHDPMNEFSMEEIKILSMKVRSLNKMKIQLSWLERMTVNHDVEGSSPSVPASAYISLGLEMIQRPMHYLFEKGSVSDEKEIINSRRIIT